MVESARSALAESTVPPRAAGRGIYAAAISHELPELPLAENGHLDDPDLRENFVTRTYAYAHWRRFAALGTNARGLHTGNSSRLLSAIDGARLNDRSR